MDTAKKILNSMKLRFGKIAESNDPVEIKELNVVPNDFLKTNLELNEVLENDLKDYLNSIVHIIAFSQGHFDMDDLFMKMEPEPTHFCFLSELNGRPVFYLPRMWATYGEKHTGVCFMFDKNMLISIAEKRLKEDYFFKHKKIKYSDFISGNALTKMWQTHIFDVEGVSKLGYKTVQKYLKKHNSNYFIKDVDWRDEREYRFLCWNKTIKKRDDVIELDIKSALVGIVLGLNCDEAEILKTENSRKIDHIFKLSFDSDVKLLRL